MSFYQQVNKEWLSSNNIPDDYQRWGCFEEVHEETQHRLKKMMEESTNSLYGQMYKLGIDMETRNKQGLEPLQCILKEIQNLTKDNMFRTLSYLHTLGLSLPINRYVSSDSKNSSMNVVHICQGGLGLPDRDYYFEEDKLTQQKEYKKCLQQMLSILYKTTITEQTVDDIYQIEKQLAEFHLTRTERRDPVKTYNPYTLESLNKDYPEIKWNDLFGCSPSKIIVESTQWLKNTVSFLHTIDIKKLQSYLTAKILFNFSVYLDENIYQSYFEYVKVLTGQKKPKPLWKRVLSTVDTLLGELIGKDYVELYFPSSSKQNMIVLVNNLITSFENRLKKVVWMTEETKSKAIEKLSLLRVKIGYPDKWRDYSQLNLEGSSFFEYYLLCHQFEFKYEWDQYDKPVDKDKWEMNAHEINAYYHPTQHEIVFPAGILQAPFYSPEYTLAENYGAIGAVIGHEITHGFDDQGRHYDKEGNLKDWWKSEDSEEFNRLTKNLSTQYSEYTVEDTHVNGDLTLGENIADLGGLTISYHAWKLSGDNSSPELFFNSWARVWRNLIRPEEAKRLVVIDPHSPGKYRVDGVVKNMPEYYEVFSKQVENNLIKIW